MDILILVHQRGHLLQVHAVVPITHVPSVVISLLEVGSQASISHLLNVELVVRVPRADGGLNLISVLESKLVKGNKVFEDALTALILCHKLDHLIDYPLQVAICFVSYQRICI